MPYFKYISVILASTLKFLGGPITGITLGLGWIETALCATVGMMITVTITIFLGNYIIRLFSKNGQRPLFSKRTRYAVKVWKGFGIQGIAFLTPLIFTPIGGTLIALSFKVKRINIFGWMLLSAVFWGVVQSLLFFQIPFLRGLFN